MQNNNLQQNNIQQNNMQQSNMQQNNMQQNNIPNNNTQRNCSYLNDYFNKQIKFRTLIKEIQKELKSKDYIQQGYTYDEFIKIKWNISKYISFFFYLLYNKNSYFLSYTNYLYIILFFIYIITLNMYLQ